MRELLLALMRKLEAIEAKYGDLPPAEFMGSVVFQSYFRPEPGYELPDDYGMSSEEANKEVKDALAAYVTAARLQAPEEGRVTFQQRLAAFQNSGVVTENGGTYDEFFGVFARGMYTEDGKWLGPRD
jgi:hypothetical protein